MEFPLVLTYIISALSAAFLFWYDRKLEPEDDWNEISGDEMMDSSDEEEAMQLSPYRRVNQNPGGATVQTVRNELLHITSTISSSCQKALTKLDRSKDRLKKEQGRIIREIQQHDADLRQQDSQLDGLRAQLSRDKQSVKDAKDDVRRAERSVSNAQSIVRRAEREVEEKKDQKNAAAVSSIGLGGVGLIALGTALTGGTLPLVIGGAAAAGQATAAIIMVKLMKDLDEKRDALRSAESNLSSCKSTLKSRESALEDSEERVESQERKIRSTKTELKRLKEKREECDTKYEEQQEASEKLMEVVNHVSTVAVEARVADNILKHFQEVRSALTLLSDVSRHMSHEQISEFPIFSTSYQRQLTSNIERLVKLNDQISRRALVPVNSIVTDHQMVCKELMEVKPFVSGLPLIVQVIGQTAVSSNQMDFSLQDCGITEFQHLDHPESYRRCLYQVCSETRDMLSFIHQNMREIELLTQQIPFHTAYAIHLLTSDNNDVNNVASNLEKTLRGLKVIVDQALELPKGIDTRVGNFVAMVSELVECCVASHSLSQREKAKAEAAYKEAKKEIKKAEREKRQMIEDMKRYEEDLQTANDRVEKRLTDLPHLMDHITDLRKKHNDKIKKRVEKEEKARRFVMKKIEAAGSSSSLGEAVENLSHAIEGVNSIKRQYAWFTERFQQVSNRMEIQLSEGLGHFKRLAEREARRAEQGRPSFPWALKKLWQEAGDACVQAQCLHLMAGEYVRASEQYVLPSANKLTRFAKPSSGQSSRDLERDLKIHCERSQKAIDRNMDDSLERMMSKIRRDSSRSLPGYRVQEPMDTDKMF